MFMKGMKWLKKATKENKEDAPTRRFEVFHVYGWIPETHTVKLINEYASREFALERAEYYKNFYPSVVVHDQDGKIIKML